MLKIYQQTLNNSVSFNGVGLHNGKKCALKINPSENNSGIIFKRVDLQENNLIVANYNNVTSAKLCTTLANEFGIKVSTVEHLMAGVGGCGIKNALVEINGPEVPILDGSAVTFVKEILKTGIKLQKSSLKAVRILKTVKYKKDTAWAKFEPSDYPRMSFSIEFSEEVIGSQSKTLDMSNGSFVLSYFANF